jgi:hypothetical protein
VKHGAYLEVNKEEGKNHNNNGEEDEDSVVLFVSIRGRKRVFGGRGDLID